MKTMINKRKFCNGDRATITNFPFCARLLYGLALLVGTVCLISAYEVKGMLGPY